MMSKDQYNLGMNMLSKFLKAVDVKVDGTRVIYTQVLDFGDETIAKMFGKKIVEMYGGGK